MDLASTLPAIHSDITPKRLSYIARLVLRVWRKARKTHRPKEGDSMWGFGTKFHERMCHALRVAAKRFNWLRVIEKRLHFVFTIGAVPFRFYRGYANRPKKNYLLRRVREKEQQVLAGVDIDWCCRIAIESGEVDKAPRVILVQHSVSTGEVRNAWHVDSDGKTLSEAPAPLVKEPSNQLSFAREPAIQPKPQIAIKPAAERKTSASDETP